MNQGLDRLTADRRTLLAVVQMDGSWRLLLNGEWIGRFDHRADATKCATDIAAQTRREGHRVEVLLHDPLGEVNVLPESARWC